MNIFSLENKTAVVTGANGKLGEVWVRALASAGAKVLATDLHKCMGKGIAAIADTASESVAGVAYFGGVDISVREDAQRLSEYCKETFGVADILVNNAGIDSPPTQDARNFTIEDYPAEIFCEIMKVNAFGTFNMIQVLGNEMRIEGKGGSIINIGSLYASVSPDERFYDHLGGETPFIKPPAYGMSKAAVVNMTRYLAAHWGRYGIRVNALSPGGVLGGQDPDFRKKFTDRVPLGRMAELGDLEGPLVFLASDASKYVTGININIDGGFTAW